MPTQPSDVPLEPEPQSAGDPAPVLGGAVGDDAPPAPDPSLEAAVVDDPDDALPVLPSDEVAAPIVPPASAESVESPEPRTQAEELARLRAQVDALLNDPFDEWVERIQVGGVTVTGFERTLSWRVTKPLRLVRTFQIRVDQLGLPGAIGHSARFVKRRLSGRTR